MRIAICDDEKVFVDQLNKFLRNCIPYIEENYSQVAVEFYSSGEELLEAYEKNKRFDLLFLDIKMHRLNGLETANQIRLMDNEVIIVFITSLVECVFKSFEYKPFWYLVKPVNDIKFKDVLYKAASEHHAKNSCEYYFKTREEGVECINVCKIMYLESLSRQIRLRTLEGDFHFYASISREEEKLVPLGFLRIHKSYLVNILFFQKVCKSHLILKNGEELPISERRYKDVFDAYTNYLARNTI